MLIKTPSVTIEEITPARAHEFLSRNTSNIRKPHPPTVAKYARMMSAGEWHLTGEAIIFDWNDVLVTGQHRCLAIIKSGVTIRTAVMRGVDPDSRMVEGTGKPYGASIKFTQYGVENASTAASMARWIKALARENPTNGESLAISPQELYDTYLEHPLIARFASKATLRRLMQAPCVAVLVLAAEMHGTEVVDAFTDAFSSGANLDKGSPVLALRDRLIANKTSAAKIRAEMQVALTIKAMNAYVSGTTIGVLRWSPSTEFPKLEAAK